MDAGPPAHTGPRFVTRVLEGGEFSDVRILGFRAYFFPRWYKEKNNDIGDDYTSREDVYGEHKFTRTW